MITKKPLMFLKWSEIEKKSTALQRLPLKTPF